MRYENDVNTKHNCESAVLIMITLSSHASFQDGVFSMYQQLKEEYNVWTITRRNDDYPVLRDKKNIFICAPRNPGLSKETFRLREWMRMISVIKKIKPTHVYLESFHVWNYPIMLYCKIKKIVLACALNDVVLHSGDSHIGFKKIINASQVIFADRVVLRSRDGLINARNMYRRYSMKMHRTDIWYSFPPYCPPRERNILFFGRMNKYKGIERLYELINMTPELSYVVAGKADESDYSIIERIRELPNVKLEDCIVPYNEMHDYFYNSRCVVLPYISATQSGVIVDAYKHSRPVVAFNVGALGEQIKDGETGYVVDSGNINELANKIRAIAKMDDILYEDMCKKAYAFGLNNYSVQSQKDNFLDSIGIT